MLDLETRSGGCRAYRASKFVPSGLACCRSILGLNTARLERPIRQGYHCPVCDPNKSNFGEPREWRTEINRET